MEMSLKLNAKFQPIHRFELEDALQEILEKSEKGEVIGGGTLQTPTGEIEYCEIDFALNETGEDAQRWLSGLLNRIGIPKGSVLSGDDFSENVGTLEGMAVYLNGTELLPEVYKSCDVNYAIEKLESAMDGIGSMYSFWESNEYTALYFYGLSFEQMKTSIEPFVKEYPLCQKCRIEQIA